MRRCGSSGSGRRPNADEWALQGRLEAVAATVMDGETASRCAKKGAPASDTEKSALPESCWFTFVLGPFLARGALAPVTCRSACLQRPASTKASMNWRCKVVSGQWRRRSLTARRFRAAPRRALRRAIPRKVHFQRAAGLRSSPGRSWRALVVAIPLRVLLRPGDQRRLPSLSRISISSTSPTSSTTSSIASFNSCVNFIWNARLAPNKRFSAFWQ